MCGAILAGGESRRFGAPKALAAVGGRRIVDRVRSALDEASIAPVVIVANQPALFAELHLPIRADRTPGLGPLAGIDAALRWAAESGADGAVCVSCDAPFISPALLREIALRAATGGRCDAVVPDGGAAANGLQPLCAWYSVRCLPAIARALSSADRSLRGLMGAVRAEVIAGDEVRRCGDPAILFFNVNTRDDLARAEIIARSTDARS